MMISNRVIKQHLWTQVRWPRILFPINLGGLITMICIWLFQGSFSTQVITEATMYDGLAKPIKIITHENLSPEVVDQGTHRPQDVTSYSQVMTGIFTEVWFDDVTGPTKSIAWGDIDGDGDLDLAVGNSSQVNRLYKNDGSGFFIEIVDALGTSVDSTTSLAWGDMDNDGDLDLAIGNYGQTNRLYQNDGNGVFSELINALGTSPDLTYSLAWGDMDEDGDLDLAVGNEFPMNKLYRNDGSSVFTEMVGALGTTSRGTHSLAWGDMDSDGDLDLAIGSWHNASSLFQNNGHGVFTEIVGALELNRDDITSFAWGDMDGDGDLDLAVGNAYPRNRLYRNDGGGIFTEMVGVLGAATETHSLAWGDMDSDGDLDLAISGQENRLYRNDGSGIFTEIVGVLGTTFGTALAWGDMDSDGDLDLAVGGGDYSVSRLYQNNDFRGFIELIGVLGTATDITYNLAWGDIDSDGDLDLAVDNINQVNRLYRNDGNGIFTELVSALGTTIDYSHNLAWGDMDGDSDLDLAIASRLYQNNGAGVFTEVQDLGGNNISIYNFAWGDMDDDGDLDLAVGNSNAVNRLYRNDGSGVFTEMAGAFGITIDGTTSLAWGDIDGDKDLDLAVGNTLEVDRLYRNDGSGFFTEIVDALGTSVDFTTSLAWGDMDNDGDLDLAIGNGNTLNRLYQNNGTGLFTELAGALGLGDYTDSLAWADFDSDGDIDLAVEGFQGIHLYQNNGNGVFTRLVGTLGTSSVSISSMAWGDIDGDGDIDLAIGYFNQVNQIYENKLHPSSGLPNNIPLIATTRPITTASANFYASPAIIGTSVITIPFTVFDPEGNTIGRLDGFYSPTGGGYWLPAVATSTTITSHLSGASFDDFDPGVNTVQWANISGGSATTAICGGAAGKSLNFDGSSVRSATTIPVDVTYGGTIYFSLKIGDANNASACQTVAPGSENVLFEYSTDNGATWYSLASYSGGDYTGFTPVAVPIPAAARTANTQFRWRQPTHSSTSGDNWAIDNIAFPQYYYWDTFASGFFGQSDNVTLRFEVFEQPSITGTYRYTNTVPGSFQHPYTSFTTFPFRVRGTQVRVFTDTVTIGNELPRAIVYRLPAGQQNSAQPMANLSSGQIWHTDVNGYLQGQAELGIGDQLMALYPISATQYYTVYYTSAPVTITGTQMFEVEHPGVQNLVVSPENVLIIYNLVVSLEWDARHDTTFLTQLENDLRRTSELLYDWTNGQVALGNIRIYHDKGFWGHANIVIQANNSQRPSSVLGGIVITPTHDIGVTGPIPNAYIPGQVRMPPAWNRFGDPGGTLGEDWPRTLAHELGHYLLFLTDNYLGLTAQGYLTSTDCVGSAMSDPYDEAYSEFLRRQEWAGDCLNTLAETYLGRADWQTILHHYPVLNGSTVITGPGTLPLAVTQIQTFAPITPTNTLAAPFFQLKDASGTTIAIPAGRAQAYLIKTSGVGDPTDDYVIYLGAPVGNLVQARGAAPGDRLCVVDYSQEPLRYGCLTVGTTATPLTLRQVPNWEPQIVVSGISTTTVAVTVTNVSDSNLMIQLLPALGSASVEVMMNPAGSGTFTQTVTAPDGAYYGLIRIWVPGSNPLKEMFLVYAIIDDWGGQGYVWGGQGYVWGDPGNGWGGQGYVWGGHAWAWGGQGYVWGAPLMSTDGQVSIFPLDDLLGNDRNFTIQTLVLPPNLPQWLTPVGQAYRLQASENMPQSGILFQYVARDVPLGYEHPNRLAIYYSPDDGQTWQELSTELDTSHNHASALVPGPGIFVLISTLRLPSFDQGWNLFSYDIHETRPVAESLASIEGSYTVIANQDQNRPDPWQTYYVSVTAPFSPMVNTLHHLEDQSIYWIYATEPITLYFQPDGFGNTNNVNGLQSPPTTFYGWITPTVEFTATVGTSVTAWIDGHLCGQTTVRAFPNNQLYYVLRVVSENISGGSNGCGHEGDTVVFQVGGVLMDHDHPWENHLAWFHALTIIADIISPTLTVPQTITAEATGPTGVVVTYIVTAVDNRDPNPIVVCSPVSGSTFPLGVTVVSCTATDASGNSATDSFEVHVVDTTPPTLAVPNDIIIEATSPAGAPVAYTTAVTDTVDPNPTVSCNPASGSTFPLGLTQVPCVVSDFSGNSITQTFTITVVDTSPPVLTVPTTITVEATGPSGAIATYTVTAIDIVDINPIVQCSPPSGSVFPLGNTIVHCVATDTSGNSASDSFVVSVVDTIPPILNLPPDITVETSNPQGMSVTYVVTATDIVDPNPLITCIPASGSIFPIGTTTVSCIATDGSGNQTPGTFTVTVNQFYRVFMPIILRPQSQTTQINPSKTVLTPEGLNPVRSSRLFGKPGTTSGSLAKIIPATQELNYQNGQGIDLHNVPLQYPDPMSKPNSKVIRKMEMLLPIQRGKERCRNKET